MEAHILVQCTENHIERTMYVVSYIGYNLWRLIKRVQIMRHKKV